MKDTIGIAIFALTVITILCWHIMWDENNKHLLRLECIKSGKSLIEKSCVEMR
jgi:hypothetical protein